MKWARTRTKVSGPRPHALPQGDSPRHPVGLNPVGYSGNLGRPADGHYLNRSVSDQSLRGTVLHLASLYRREPGRRRPCLTTPTTRWPTGGQPAGGVTQNAKP